VPENTLPEGDDPADEREDVKRKFREALQRKHGHTATQSESAERTDAGKVHGAHGPESVRRSFRRKSG
jgi:hypothetical protein